MKFDYKPKKDGYNDLRGLVKEMRDNNVKILKDTGGEITIKGGRKYSLYDGQIIISESGKS